ncbi:hypothetical protein JDV02_010006 [Purpureocillium takamizusanense]|uniref:Zn(2)-C6 fungal-type domain-containing protein n=1 Tax=Purpureocillium takamizusanense TaxID=2060973 RepID=A0A9Q8VG43_9HYPO|nr:uncharacterized protein JDV02_010006 [Purpureocillium takamizusanense]UNI24243.1 hypothetical protein JDV02_010006 [Purpureocillium takamizusanense]
MCRVRRIKCDETRPTCKQCARARRTCPGYREAESVGDSSRSRTGEAADRQPPASRTSSRPLASKTQKGQSDFSSESEYSTTPVIMNEEAIQGLLQLPVEDLASCHFIANYVLIPRQHILSTRGFLEFLLPLLKSGARIPHFKHAFDACALASLNNRVGNGNEFDKQALGSYTKALAATFAALKDPELVKKDETLAAILLLGLFENISAKSLGMMAWSSHIEGAVQLVKARGPAQLSTKTGMDLFVAVRTQMIIHSLSTGKGPSLDVNWWVDDNPNSEYGVQFLRLSSRTSELKNETNHLLATVHKTPENTERMKKAMEKCQDLDKEIVEWLEELPESFRWKTVAWEDYNPKCDYSKAEAFPGRIDMYADLWVVNLWNVMRCMRIVLASLIVRFTAWTISPADYRTTPEYAAGARVCVEAIADIIASVPYQLGWFAKHQDLRERAQLSGFACGEDDAEKGLAGYFLLWPLTCIQGQDCLTDAQRIWVKGRLKCIGNQVGVRYGNMLSQLNVRMPSMLILRDRLVNNPHNTPPADMASFLANQAAVAKATPSAPPGPTRRPPSPDGQSKQEAALKRVIKRQTEELKKKAVDTSATVDEWTVKTWLQL